MILFKKYSSIKNFLTRFTLIKIGNLHIRFHTILDKDRTTLFHNHPFNYVSIILKGGYTETYIESEITKRRKHGFLSVIKRKHDVKHRIEDIKGKTLTLFIAYGKYDWSAFNMEHADDDDGVYEREVLGANVWSKKEKGIWFVGNIDKDIAMKETRHSIHQV